MSKVQCKYVSREIFGSHGLCFRTRIVGIAFNTINIYFNIFIFSIINNILI